MYSFSSHSCSLQRSRDSITIEDISPSENDARVLKERAMRYIMDFLVTTFPSLSDLAEFVPAVEPLHPVKKSEVIQMKLLLKDDKYKSETIDILTQLYCDAGLSGDQQVSLFNCLTCATSVNTITVFN